MTGILATLAGIKTAIATAVDAYFNLVTLLLPGNGTNGAQNNTFLDSSSNAFSITRNGNTTQGTFSPFSQTGWSNYFDGDDSLNLPSTSSLAFGTGDFCVEFWVYRTGSAGGGLFSNSASSGGGDAQFEIQINASNKVLLLGWNTIFMTSATSINLNVWNHIAVVRSGTSMAIFINGTRDVTATSANNFSSTNAFYIARQAGGSGFLTGYLSNLRAVKGSSVYDPASTSITVPTSTLTNITNTSLLTCQSNRFVDNGTANSGSGFTITVNGNPSVQAFAPFAPTAAYSATTNGGSGYFDGSGDYLSAAANSALAAGTGNFAIQCWVYFTSVSGTILPICQSDAIGTSSTDKFWVGIQSNTLRLAQHSTANAATCPLTPVANTWYNIAISRVSGTVYMWVNGVSQTVTNSTVFSSTSFSQNGFVIGGMSTPYYVSGYIAGFQYQVGTGFTSYSLPTAPIASPGDTNAQLLLNFTNAGITDATAKNDLETVGNAQISTTQSKFGGSSMYFDGTGDWLTVIDNPNLRMEGGDFTIEGWFYLSATGVAYGIVSKGTSTTGWSVNVTSGNKLQFSYTSSNLTGATTLSSATWYYFAVVRSGTATGNLKIYLNGSADATSGGAVTDTFNQTSIMYVGADRVGGSALNGYIDDLRITKGYARSITASPSSAFPLQ